MDRLIDLQNMNQKKVVYKEQLEQDDGQFLPQFQEKVQQAKNILKKITCNNDQVEQLKARYQKATTGEKDILRELDQIIQENAQHNNKLKDIMNNIAQDVEISRNKDPNDTETKNKQTIQQALQNNVNDVLQRQQTVQIQFKAGLKEKLARQTRYLDSNLTEEQIDDLSNDPQKAQELFQKKLYGTASLQLQNTISDMQDKYKDIEKLERSVQQVYQLFVDLAMLVNQQGEMIDDIEANIQEAKKNVSKGEKNLQQAKEHHQVARKRMCCLLVIGLIIILVIVLPITLRK